MALVVFISSFLITSTVHDTMANETAVDMNCWCNSIGFKTVNIIWEPLPQEPNLFFESVYYRVFFCTYESHRCDIDITNRKQGVHYHLGCTLNTSANLQSVSQQSKLKCSISRTGDTLFDPHGFHFIVEMRNSSGVFISRKKTCRLASNVECAKPQNVKVIAKGKRNLSISWIPSWEMERYAQFLCYRIWYSSSQAKRNESIEMKSHPGKLLTYTIRDLSPHTKYTLFIQCGLLNCLNGWGPLSGPLFVLTDEEVPDKAPEFENNNFFNISNNDDKKRDESVFWKLPPMNTWNGVLRKFEIYYWQLPSKENFSNVNSVSNRSRMLQINSGSAKEATLIGLSRFDDYEAKISMCNSQGCGPNSGPLVLRGDNERKKSKWGAATSKSLHNNSFVKIAVGASIIAVVLSIIVCVVIYKFRESRRRRKTPLNKLWNSRDLNPDDVEDVEEIEPVPSNANSYDLIGVPRIPNKSIPLLDELQMDQGSSEVDA